MYILYILVYIYIYICIINESVFLKACIIDLLLTWLGVGATDRRLALPRSGKCIWGMLFVCIYKVLKANQSYVGFLYGAEMRERHIHTVVYTLVV